jgi:hypothetical protein
MACTRFNYYPCRTKKNLQQSTGPGRWVLNVPGNGSEPCYMEDPHIRMQKWGANLCVNSLQIENELRGGRQPLSRDCLDNDYLGKNQYKQSVKSIAYPSCKSVFTEQSRSTNPAWWYRELEQVDWYYPPLNPQENTCIHFQANVNTRIIEKDSFFLKRDCFLNENTRDLLPVNFSLIKGTFAGGPITCQQTNSCESVISNKK